MNQTGPHAFHPLRRFFNRGRCRHCYVHADAHPVNGWVLSRPLGDKRLPWEQKASSSRDPGRPL
jgi:hypothetical protein